MNVPKLRFSEFKIEWQISKINKVTEYVDYRGKTPLKSDSGTFLVTAKNIKQGYIDYEISKEYIPNRYYEEVMRRGKPKLGDVLITTEAPLGNIACIDDDKIALAQRVIKLRGKLDILQNLFLKYRLMSPQFQKLIGIKSTGSTAKGIKGSELHKLEILFPALPEQTKIAAFLIAVDEKLTQLKKKKTLLEQYKKGVMQKIFSQEIRFKDENGKYFPEWIRKTLGEVTERIGDGLHGTPAYTQNTGFYFINGNNLINGSIVINETTKEVDLETYKKNRKGLNDNTLLISLNGTIGNVARYQNEKVMLGKSAGYFNFKENTNFYYYLLKTDYVQNYFKSEITGSTIKNLSLKTLRETELLLPSHAEQTKIANFLSAIDDKISHCQKQIEKTELWKKGLLQKMFI